MIKPNFIFILFILILTSCASKHEFMRGTVVMKIDQSHAYVCLGDKDLVVGTKLSFYTFECRGSGRGDFIASYDCRKHKLGTGKVSKLLNSHYSEVKLNGKFKIKEGMLVEKIK